MKLASKNFCERLPTLKQIENIPFSQRRIHGHFYNPIGEGDWFVMAGEKYQDDFLFYGLQILDEQKLCEFTLGELERVRLPFSERIRRNERFKEISFEKLMTLLNLSF